MEGRGNGRLKVRFIRLRQTFTIHKSNNSEYNYQSIAIELAI